MLRIDDRSAPAEPVLGSQPSARMRSVLRRTIGTSPFQPRDSVPVADIGPLGSRSELLERELDDLAHRDVVAGGDVERGERSLQVGVHVR